MFCLSAVSLTYGQQATERYIPIGSSPGVSGTDSVIGTISAVDYETRSMQIDGADGTVTVTMDDATRYYVDLTGAGRSNRTGSLRSCEAGQRVEVRLRADGKVDWIKTASSE